MLRSLIAVLAAASPCVAQVNFYRFGAPPEVSGSQATAISADGAVALGTMFAPTPPDTWVIRWTAAGGSERLVEPSTLRAPFVSTSNADGSVIVGWGATNSGRTGFRWTRDTGYVLTPGYTFSDISDDSNFIIGNQNAGTQPMRWSESGGYEILGASGAALRTSANGSVVIGSGASVTGGGWRWSQSTGQVAIGDLPAGWETSNPVDVSSDGSTIVGDLSHFGPSDTDHRAFRWTLDAGYTLLAELPNASDTYARAVAADGLTAVGRATIDSQDHAVLWTSDGQIHILQDYLESRGVNLDGWTLEIATGISDDGLTIVGNGRSPEGMTEGWVVHIPTPATALAFALLLHPRRRRA